MKIIYVVWVLGQQAGLEPAASRKGGWGWVCVRALYHLSYCCRVNM